jgi:hypothetical protein
MYVYRCTRCKVTRKITQAEFVRLREMTHLEIAKHLPDLVLSHYMD